MGFFNKYPYTDFHELNLDWILSEITRIATEWVSYQNEMNQKYNSLDEAFTALKNHVDTFFAELDLQEEVNIKLNRMAADGTLSALINPIIIPLVTTYTAPIFVNSVSDMDDITRIYVLTSSGHIYYYDVDAGAFVDSGRAYGLTNNSVGTQQLQNESVTYNKLANNVRNVEAITGGNIDLTGDIVTLTITSLVASGYGFTGIASPQTVNVAGNKPCYIGFRPTTKTFEMYVGALYQYDGIVIAYVRSDLNILVPFIDNVDKTFNGNNIDAKSISFITGTLPVVYDFTSETMTIPANTVIRTQLSTRTLSAPVVVSLTPAFGNILFDTITGNITASSSTKIPNTSLIIGWYWKARNHAEWFFGKYSIITKYENGLIQTVKPTTAIFGDSIVAGAGSGVICYLDILYREYGITIHNYGIGGCGYVTKTPEGTTHRIGNGEIGRASEQLVSRDYDVITYLNEKLSTIPDVFVAVMCGVNDWSKNVSIEDFRTAIENVVDAISAAGKIPVLIAPIRKDGFNSLGFTLTDYANVIKEVASNKTAAFIDAHNDTVFCSGLSSSTLLYDAAGTHPSETGGVALATILATGLSRIGVVLPK